MQVIILNLVAVVNLSSDLPELKQLNASLLVILAKGILIPKYFAARSDFSRGLNFLISACVITSLQVALENLDFQAACKE